MVCHKNVLMCIKKVKLIYHDYLPILMLLYIMLAYLMLFAALSNAVCLYNAFIVMLLIFANAFYLGLYLSIFLYIVFFLSS